MSQQHRVLVEAPQGRTPAVPEVRYIVHSILRYLHDRGISTEFPELLDYGDLMGLTPVTPAFCSPVHERDHSGEPGAQANPADTDLAFQRLYIQCDLVCVLSPIQEVASLSEGRVHQNLSARNPDIWPATFSSDLVQILQEDNSLLPLSEDVGWMEGREDFVREASDRSFSYTTAKCCNLWRLPEERPARGITKGTDD